MGQWPLADRVRASESRGGRLLKSLATGVVGAANDPNLVVVLFIFTAVCLLALNVDALAPDLRLAMRQLGPCP
jgi:hypothetical protein